MAVILTGVAARTAYAGDQNRDRERVARSGEALAKSRSAKFRGTSTAELKGGVDAKVTFDGRFDFANRAGEYSLDAGAIGLQGNGKVRALLVGGVVFVKLDALGSSIEIPGKKW